MTECTSVLTEWGKDITGSFKQRIHTHKRVIKSLKRKRDAISVEIVKENQKNLAEVYAQQEIFWKQRAKQMWLKEGDQNTKFFHAAVKNRRSVNQIKRLQNKDGMLVDWISGLEGVMIDYFNELFTASRQIGMQ